MSSSEDAGCDLRDYFSYTTQNYGQDERPPLISKKSRIIFAVVGGDVEALESLLDSPRWYNVRDQSGHDLLQIAILLYKRQVFNFLLLLEGYPFDAVGKRGLTPLHVAVTVGHRKEYFAMKLIRKGADVHATSKSGDTPLHYAIYRDCNLKIVEFLIINGADINAQNCDGETPLHKMFTQLSMNSAVLIEAVSMILYYGSDVSIPNKLGQNALEVALSLYCDENLRVVQENLLFLTVDEYSVFTLPFDTVLLLIYTKSPLYFKIIDSMTDVTIFPDEQYVELNCFCGFLIVIDNEYLRPLRTKFTHVLEKFFFISCGCPWGRGFLYKDFGVLFEMDLLFDTLEFLENLRFHSLFEFFFNQKIHPLHLASLYEYLLTYGIEVYQNDLECVYRVFDYCELFKILLHMDVKDWEGDKRQIFPAVVYDVTIDLETFFKERHNYSEFSIHMLLHHFTHPKLKYICQTVNIESLNAKARRLPNVPLLVELARNASRKYLCRRFNITTCKAFYSMLRWIPLNTVYKKIISFETILYNK